MAGTIEAIFESKTNLFNSYNQQVAEYAKNFPTRIFDLHRTHFLYGKIDRNSNAVYLDAQGNTDSVAAHGNKTEFVVDFVKDAFEALRKSYRTKITQGVLDPASPWGRDLFVKGAFRKGDLRHSYYRYYMDKIYTTFVNNYLSIDRRHEKITNFKTFVKVFMDYMTQIAYYFPLTLTGFILSIHCSPYISGLMIDLQIEKHGTQDNFNVIKYADPTGAWPFMLNETKKFGFMIDRNAPWRLIFNLASGYWTTSTVAYGGFEGDVDELMLATKLKSGGSYWMKRKGQTLDNIFESYFVRAHLTELRNIRKVLRELYQAYYAQFSTYYKIEYFMPNISETVPWVRGESGCYGVKTKSIKKNREAYPTILGPADQVDEYFLKILLKLRMLETAHEHDNREFTARLKKMTDLYRLFGDEAALNYINNFTKGLHDSKFIRRGKGWYGQGPLEYTERLRKANEKLDSPDQVNYEITGTGNIKRG